MSMKCFCRLLFFVFWANTASAQTVTDHKGTKILIDSSKWKIAGNHLYNKNTGNIGIGTAIPTAQLHTTGSVRFEGISTNTTQTRLITSDANGNLSSRTFASLLSSSGQRQILQLSSDVSNNNSVGNTLEDIPGFSFSVVAGNTYRFFILIPYTSSTSSNGSRWTINTPTTQFLSYVSRNTQNANSEAVNYANLPNLPASCNNTSNSNGNLATIEGVILPSVNGIVQVRFASEVGGATITAKAGATIEWW